MNFNKIKIFLSKEILIMYLKQILKLFININKLIHLCKNKIKIKEFNIIIIQ
jgi:hypothetical protein